MSTPPTDCDSTPSMIPMRDARRRVLESIDTEAQRLPTEWVFIGDALGRVLEETVVAQRSLPPLRTSAMDGYALRGAELTAGAGFEVVDESAAGRPAERGVSAGEAIRIFTGAPMPEGADTVVMQEICDRDGTRVIVREAKKVGDNVRPPGEDMTAGDAVLAAGTRIGPSEIGILAAVGCATVPVRHRPRVAVISSGDELVEIGQPLAASQIVSSNDHALVAAVRQSGGTAVRMGIAGDTEAALDRVLSDAKRCDAIVTSGGVSVGDHDLMRAALEKAGYEERFWRVAMKPGKPFAFGLLDGRPCFGLPGNPVSTLVTFELFARPALRRMLGHRAVLRPELEAVYVGEATLKGTRARANFLRGILAQQADGSYVVRASGRQGSGQLAAMAGYNALIELPAGAEPVTSGARVHVHLISDGTL